MSALTESEQRARYLFDNETEGACLDPRRVYQMYNDDALNAEMDHLLSRKTSFWRRLWDKFAG